MTDKAQGGGGGGVDFPGVPLWLVTQCLRLLPEKHTGGHHCSLGWTAKFKGALIPLDWALPSWF